jgi:hypothetical protein
MGMISVPDFKSSLVTTVRVTFDPFDVFAFAVTFTGSGLAVMDGVVSGSALANEMEA